MVSPLSTRYVGVSWALTRLAFIVGLVFMAVQPVVAQSHQERRSREQVRRDQASPSSNSSSNLPDWAEPAQRQNESPSKSGATAKAVPPPPPDDPEQVPVDGGLALLAAAGAGYAVRKLNEEDEDSIA